MKKVDYALIIVIGIMMTSAVYMINERNIEHQAEMAALQEAADSWADINDCDMMLSKTVQLATSPNFIGKDIIADAISARMAEVCK